MKTEVKKIYRVAIAAAIAVIFAATTVLTGVVSASAVPDGTIDPAQDGKASITIHKYLYNGDAPGEATGTADDAANVPGDAKALQHVKFKIEKLYTKNEIWTTDGQQEAAGLTIGSEADGTWAAQELETDATGTISLTGLPLGVYRVTEQDSPDATPLDGGTLQPVAPFLVYVPLTKVSGTSPNQEWSWIYNVHVFPKNQSKQDVKTVTDAGKNVGDEIVFDLFTEIPAPAAGTNYDDYFTYKIYDELDKKLKYESATVKVRPTADGTDEDLSPAPKITHDPTSNGVNIVFEKADTSITPVPASSVNALAKYKVAHPDARVHVQIKATVQALVAGETGTIKNVGTTFHNNGDGNGETITHTNETTSQFGRVEIVKSSNSGEKLPGAKFNLYLCTQDKGGKIVLDANPLTVNGKTELVTDSAGVIAIDGLHATDIVDGKPSTKKQYCLVEIEAPEGYELLPEPVPFTLETGTITQDPKTPVNIPVTNYPASSIQLPKTGGPGIIIMIIAGVAIVVGGAVYGLRSRKKSE